MCLSEGRREREETILGEKAASQSCFRLQRRLCRNLLQAFLTSQLFPSAPFPPAAWKQNSFFSKQVVIIFMAWSISVCQENI